MPLYRTHDGATLCGRCASGEAFPVAEVPSRRLWDPFRACDRCGAGEDGPDPTPSLGREAGRHSGRRLGLPRFRR